MFGIFEGNNDASAGVKACNVSGYKDRYRLWRLIKLWPSSSIAAMKNQISERRYLRVDWIKEVKKRQNEDGKNNPTSSYFNKLSHVITKDEEVKKKEGDKSEDVDEEHEEEEAKSKKEKSSKTAKRRKESSEEE
jgi:hypothetical protein